MIEIALSTYSDVESGNFVDFLVSKEYSYRIPRTEENQQVKKVLIKLYESKESSDVEFFNERGSELPFLIVKCGADFGQFRNGSEYQQKIWQLEYIDRSFRFLCSVYNWDYGIYSEIKSQMISSNFDFTWGVKKPLTSKNRRFNMQVICKPQYSTADYYLVLGEKKDSEYQAIESFHIFKGGPGDELWPSFFGKQKWIDNTCYILESRFSELSFQVNAEDISCKLEFSNVKEQQDHILMLMGMWFHSKSKKEFNDFFKPLNPEIERYQVKKFTEPIWFEGNNEN